MLIPEWRKTIETELEKLQLHNCLIIISIKTDGTYKARTTGRGDLMLPWIGFNPKEIYCSNISTYGIKLILAFAAFYKLRMRGGDLVRAYLVIRANKDSQCSSSPQKNRGATRYVHTSSR